MAKLVATEHGALDVLVNCAGYVHQGNVLDCSEQDWDFSFDLNVKSMHRTIKAFLPGMLARRFGRIVNVASLAGLAPGLAGSTLYASAKAFLIKFSQSLHLETHGTGVHVNALCPGFTYTE